MDQQVIKKNLGIAALFAGTAVVIAGTGLLFYQVLAAFDTNLGTDNNLVFVVPKDQQKEDIAEALRRIQEDLEQTNTISDEDLQVLDEIKSLLDLGDELLIPASSTN